MSCVAIIPARGGSTRIPKKNIRPFRGRPIIDYSIRAALESGLFTTVVVSTDDDAIAEVAQKSGANIHRRPARFCLDEVGTQEVMSIVLRDVEAERRDVLDFACCIYATAPMLKPDDLRFGYEKLRQCESPSFFYIPGIFYWGRVESFRRLIAPESDGLELAVEPCERFIDINTEEDWQRAEMLYPTLQGAKP